MTQSTNPYTHDLLERLSDPPPGLDDFIQAWDRLETLVIAVFRDGEADALEEGRFAEVARWLRSHYAAFESDLAPHWADVRAGGRPLLADPFRTLFEAPDAASFADNWSAMQLLPAAREALNRWLVALAGDTI